MKKFIVLLIVSCMLTASFACGVPDDNSPATNSDTNVIIEMYLGGYGDAAIRKIAKDFEKDYKEEGYTVSITSNGGLVGTNVMNKLQSGITNVDLFLTAMVSVDNIVSRGNKFIAGYDCGLEDLTSLYESPVAGETVLFKDKMNKEYYDFNTYKEKQYSMSWAAGPSGIAYRADFFKNNNWQIPRTTSELTEVANQIKQAGYVPYIWSNSGSYWYYSVLTWWRQLIGDQEFDDFWNAIDLKTGEMGPECFKTQSRLTAFNELEKILANPELSYYRSGTAGNIEAQQYLYDTNNKIAMMANSDWLENEMKGSEIEPGEVDVGLMRSPVISSVIYEYDQTGNRNFRFETVRDEDTLRRVIDAIDKRQPTPDGISSADYEELKVIRSYTGTEGQNHTAFIPSFANAKEPAKKFLLYLASDKAMQTYYDLTGTFMPFDRSGVVPKSNMTTFQSDVYKMVDGARYVSTFDSKNPIFFKTDLNYFMSMKIEAKIATTSAIDKMTGQEFWQECFNKANNLWENALAISQS